jgi:hypothetical protein
MNRVYHAAPCVLIATALCCPVHADDDQDILNALAIDAKVSAEIKAELNLCASIELVAKKRGILAFGHDLSVHCAMLVSAQLGAPFSAAFVRRMLAGEKK